MKLFSAKRSKEEKGEGKKQEGKKVTVSIKLNLPLPTWKKFLSSINQC